MDRLIHTPEEHTERRLKVEDPQKIHTIGSHSGEITNFSQEYSKGITIKDCFVKDIGQISQELTTLKNTDQLQPKLDQATQNLLDDFENKQTDPTILSLRNLPVYWKIEFCKDWIKYGEKRIDHLAKYNKSYKDLEEHPEDLLHHYRYLQKTPYSYLEQDIETIKSVLLYLYKEHATDLKDDFESIVANQKNPEDKHAKKLENPYENLKERYSILKNLNKGYNALKDLEPGDTNKERYHKNLKDLEECYQNRYEDPYENLEEHLKHLKELKKNLDTRHYTHLEKNLKDFEKLFSYLMENCQLHREYSKYLEKHMKALKEKWADLEKHEDSLEERCKKFEEGWKAFIESSKDYLPEIELIRKKMEDQEKELPNILDIFNNKRKDLMKLKHSLEGKQKELSTSRDPEKPSYQDDSHSVPTGFENLSLDNLTRNIDKLEKHFDDKIAIIHRDLKKLSFHLNSKLFYFLERQKYKTDFYLKNPNLLHLPADQECGIACTIMVANVSQYKDVENILQSFTEIDPKQLREDKEGFTTTYTYPLVLKKIGHYINYEYAKVPDMAMNKYETPEKNVKYDNAYRSKMGKDPKEITIDEFRNAIGQKDKDGNVIPVIASITMDFHTKCHHVIVLDG